MAKFKVGQTVTVDGDKCVVESVVLNKNGANYTVSRGGASATVLEKEVSKFVPPTPKEDSIMNVPGERMVPSDPAPQSFEPVVPAEGAEDPVQEPQNEVVSEPEGETPVQE